MASSYPGALDAIPNPTSATLMNASGFEHDLLHSAVADAVEAVQAELGTDPSGASATVKARLAAMDAVDALRVPGTKATTAPSSPATGDMWVDYSTAATPVVKIWSGSAWVNPSNAGGGSPANAVASGGTETTYTGNGTNGVNGQGYKVHTFGTGGVAAANVTGTLVVTTGGEMDVLVVGTPDSNTGAVWTPGAVAAATVKVSAGSISVRAGKAGKAGTNYPEPPSFAVGAGIDITAGMRLREAAAGAGAFAGVASYITGSLVTYGAAPGTGPGSSVQGSGGSYSGIVIFRYKV